MEKNRDLLAAQVKDWANKNIGKLSSLLTVSPYDNRDSRDLGLSYGKLENVFFSDLCAEERLAETENQKLPKFIEFSTNDLFYVRGLAGCGKTIYIHKALKEIVARESKARNTIFIKQYFDIAHYISFSKIFGYSVAKPDSTLVKFNLLLIEGIKSTVDRLHKIGATHSVCEFFEKYLMSSTQDSIDFFSLIKRLASNDLEHSRANLAANSENFYYKSHEFFFLAKENTSLLLEIICALSLGEIYFCSRTNKTSNFKVIFVFDNFEHYSYDNKATVFDKDIYDIIDSVKEFISTFYKLILDNCHSETEDILPNIRNINCRDIFKFIFVIRDTTIKTLNMSHEEEQDPYIVDVSNCFSESQMLQKKQDFFAENKYVITNRESLKVIKSLLLENDADENNQKLRTLHSFDDLFDRFYNRNKRRTTAYLTKAIDADTAKEYTRLTETNNSGEIRFAARRLALRKLFNQIKGVGYFGKIHTADGVSYTRRILTYLHNKSNEPRHTAIQSEFVSLRTLVNDVFVSPNKRSLDMSEERKMLIAEILLSLTESDINKNQWCSLVVIKFNNTKFSALDLKRKLFDEIERQDEYGIKITESGKAFAYLLPDFEYFATVFTPYPDALFHQNNANTITKKLGESGQLAALYGAKPGDFVTIPQCVDIILTVFYRAKKEIQNILENDEVYFGGDYRLMFGHDGFAKNYLYRDTHLGKQQTHIERIINTHIEYLEIFCDYVADESIAATARKVIAQYNALLNEIDRKYLYGEGLRL